MTLPHLRGLSAVEISAVLSALRDTVVVGSGSSLSSDSRSLLLDYLTECLKRCSAPRFESLLLSRDVDRILAELAKRLDP